MVSLTEASLCRLRLILPLIVILLTLAGCQDRPVQEQGGGWHRVGKWDNATMAVYGLNWSEKLEFLIVTDMPFNGTDTAVDWRRYPGHITPEKGMKVTYKRSDDRIDICGTGYEYEKGRLFLVSNKDDQITVEQVVVSFSDEGYNAEIERITSSEDVKQFLQGN